MQQPDDNFLQRYIQPTAAKPDNDFNKWLEQSDDILNLLEHDLRGDVLIEDKGGIFWQRKGRPLLNDYGISFVIGYIRHFTNKNTYMSNIDDRRVSTICLTTSIAITDALFYRWREFGISPDNFGVIVEHINNFVEFAARRAMGGGERKFLKQTESIIRHYANQPKQGFSIPNPFRRG